MKRIISIFCTLVLIFSVVFTLSLPVSAIGYDIVIDFESDVTGAKPNGWQSVDSDLVTFSDSMGENLDLRYRGAETYGLDILGDDLSELIMDFSVPMYEICFDFGNDDPRFITESDWAILTLFNGATQIGQVKVHPNADDIMNQSISYSGAAFTKATFAYSTSLIEVVDNIMLSIAPVSEEKSNSAGNHELVTLLTNPMDTSGVRTMDLNYYLNDPIIWGSDVKNITVWLETEIFDLMAAQKKVMLPSGQMLLKDYNIRLMMKIVYNDGTVETKEVDNGYIARNIPVLIPVDEFANASDLGIVYIDTQGNTAVMPVTQVVVDGMNYLQFENNHFSEYGVFSGMTEDMADTMTQQTYVIQSGDTLASIASKFGVSVQSLLDSNSISNPDLIYTGKVLVIA